MVPTGEAHEGSPIRFGFAIMNFSLFRSLWALTAVLLSAATVAWMVMAEASPGSRAHPTLQNWSGVLVLVLMVAVVGYSLRKFIHRLGWSPEFKMRTSVAALERALVRMNEIRRGVLLGHLKTRSEVEREAAAALKAEGAHRICKAVVTTGQRGGPAFEIEIRPTEPLGRVARWLHFHAYMGLASGVVLYVHGGGSFATPMAAAINGLSLLIVLTGVIGLILFAIGPRLMTRAEKDMSFEEAFVLERSLRGKIKDAYDALSEEQVARFKSAERSHSTSVMVQQTALIEIVKQDPASEKDLQDVMVLVGQRRRILDDLKQAARIRLFINSWRLLHIPATILLFGFVLIHVFSVWWY